MNEADLSICVTAHDETVVAGPSMRSAELACCAAEADGFRVERIIGLDAATSACRAYFSQDAFADWTRIELDERDLGRARNALLRQITGRWVAFLDADDLLSENWLAEAIRLLAEAEVAGERIIVHPEMNWLFDRASAVFTKPDQNDAIFSPYFFYFGNYYDSLCAAPRLAHLEVPYVSRDIPNGLSYQDWQFNIETMAAGWRHVIASDTIIFKRRRDSSLVTESKQRRSIIRAIDPMAIDRVTEMSRSPRSDALVATSRPTNSAQASAIASRHTREGEEAHRTANSPELGEWVDPKEDLRDVFICRVVTGRRFADVGGLWGTVNEKVSVAHTAGASELAMIDLTPFGTQLWCDFDERMESLGLRKVRSITGNIDDEAFVDSLGSYEVVHCSGVLYHCPSPIRTLTNLRRVTRDYLVLTSMVFPSHIESPIGKISLDEGAPLFIPNLSESSRAILSWHLATRGVANATGISERVENWRVDDYGPWWWAFTSDAVLQLVTTAGFNVVDSGENWGGRSFTVLARPKG